MAVLFMFCAEVMYMMGADRPGWQAREGRKPGRRF
jgi:hypothetical protein